MSSVATSLSFRSATADDLPTIVAVLADDGLGREREDASLPLRQDYDDAFKAMSKDENNRLVVAVLDDVIVGCLQLTFIPGLSRLGTWRCQIEGVRVAASQRGAGVGQAMMEWAIEESRQRGCRLVQLTTDRRRADAHRFYDGLGFDASHIGMKLKL